MPSPPTNGVSAASAGLYEALGRVPSGLSILTHGSRDKGSGMLVSWVQQASFEPPMVTLAINRERPITATLDAGEPFVLNLLGEGQKPLLKHFARGFKPDDPAFEGIDTAVAANGSVALTGSIAALECRVEAGVDAGDHRVLVAHVTGGTLREETPPMVHLRRRADHY